MSPVTFPQANTVFGPPDDLAESQCMKISAFVGQVRSGSVDGSTVAVVAWQPSAQDIEAIVNGAPIFLSCLGGLPPHFLTTDFQQAANPS